MRSLLFFCLFLLSSRLVYGNNLAISNVSLETRDSTQNTVIVEFDISWDSSWRNVTNYDAIWLVLKVSISAATLVHGYLDDDGVNPSGTSPGSDSNLEIEVPADNRTDATGYLGALIYRRATGSGTVTSKDVKLKLDYGLTGAADTDTMTVRVIGVEMVYVPQIEFYAGDNNTSNSVFRTGSGAPGTGPWYIDSDSTIRTANGASGTFYYQSGSNAGEFATAAQFTIPLNFPIGYNDFYCMKYEVTEGQWVEFFNNIASAAQTNRDITAASGKNSDSVVKRNTVAWTTGTATTTRDDRAVSYLSYMDLAAYLDWMALRPMSELEHEKVARGETASVAGEYAWGTAGITAGVTFSGSPEDGKITITTADAQINYNITTFSRGDDFLGAAYAQGPVRAGIFATASSTRTGSGAGYYGAMELSGNLSEFAVTVGNTTGITFFPVNGDGVINTTTTYEGHARQLGWPGTSATGTQGVSGATGAGRRGGGWSLGAARVRVSDREVAANTSTAAANDTGGRGVRGVSPPALPTCGNGTRTDPEQCDDSNTANGDGCSSTCENE